MSAEFRVDKLERNAVSTNITLAVLLLFTVFWCLFSQKEQTKRDDEQNRRISELEHQLHKEYK